ncbi:hypothetical protein PI124_g21369 [Phytophthora idaei]|nr:hypothetical protein PI125_g22095 [Phytophthora idaei]KAG3138299.1 hypothetical protein PI126_g16988 [Phytophthora idaei]KAG3233563.1 hypothetical protein PI124_g21369 [Phytophthora idaei]
MALEEKADDLMGGTPDTPEEAILSAGRSGGSCSLSRNLVDELNDVAGPERAYDDYDDEAEDSTSPVKMAQLTEQTTDNRPPANGDTSAVNRVLGRCFEEMKTSNWIQLFDPRFVRQAIWNDLNHDLARPVASATLELVAKDTVLFLKSLGLKPMEQPTQSMMEAWRPAETVAELWKWKEKFRRAFGVTGCDSGSRYEVIEPADPSRIPPPKTPTPPKSNAAKNVFTATDERSPYFQDSL